MAKPKDVELKARVTADMKREVEKIAEDRGESTSVVVREALSGYLAKQADVSTPPATSNVVQEQPAKTYGKKTGKRKIGHLTDKAWVSLSVHSDIPAGHADDIQALKPKRTAKIATSRFRPGMFGLDVTGESMNAAKGRLGSIHPGDTVLVMPFTTASEAAGKIVAANIDGRTTLKRMACPAGKPCYLQPESTAPEFAGKMHPLDEITVLGVVVGKL